MTPPVRAALAGVQHYGLTVADLGRAVEFYVDVLGGRLALSGDGFAGEDLYYTLFQREDLDAAVIGTTPAALGAVDLRPGGGYVLDVRIISFGHMGVELLHVRPTAGGPPVPTAVGRANASHLCFQVREDADLNAFAVDLEAECRRRGLPLTCNRIVKVATEADRAAADPRFAANKLWADPKYPVPGRGDAELGDFHGLGYFYCKGPNGEQLEFCQLTRSAGRAVGRAAADYLGGAG